MNIIHQFPSAFHFKERAHLKMEDIFLRFPLIGGSIIRLLDKKSLVICREVNETWKNFIDCKKLLSERMIQRHIRNNNKFLDSWKRCMVKTPTKIVKELRIAVDQFFNRDFNLIEKSQFSPLHISAGYQDPSLYKHMMNKEENKNPENEEKVTPLHIAALKGNLKICKVILKDGFLTVFH